MPGFIIFMVFYLGRIIVVTGLILSIYSKSQYDSPEVDDRWYEGNRPIRNKKDLIIWLLPFGWIRTCFIQALKEID